MPGRENLRGRLVAERLRERANLEHSMFESFTIVRHLIGKKSDVEKVSKLCLLLMIHILDLTTAFDFIHHFYLQRARY